MDDPITTNENNFFRLYYNCYQQKRVVILDGQQLSFQASMHKWSPNSWQHFTCLQAINYSIPERLTAVLNQLKHMPPLVTLEEIKMLKTHIARAARGENFILQAGDCAEAFKDCRFDRIQNQLNIIFDMGEILAANLQKPVIHIGRIAGQYAKPRSSLFECKDNITLPAYRGDLINGYDFRRKERQCDPQRLTIGYRNAANTLKQIRNHNNSTSFFTSHEALNLHYEQALTRQVADGHWYNLSTHFPWIGIRTSNVNSAHLEFIRGVDNPIGLKVGPEMTASRLREILVILNPQRQEGRLMLITRLGVEQVTNLLPKLIDATQQSNTPVTWCCDPMHGNTEILKNGIKTRHFDKILLELQVTADIHQSMESRLGGVHFELTGDNVTECLGGPQGLLPRDLQRNYHSLVDPRLNHLQSLEMARLTGKILKPHSELLELI